MNIEKSKIKKIIYGVTTAVIIVVVIFCAFFSIPPSAKRIFDKNVKSIVEIKAYSEGIGESYGTAEFIDNKGTLVTNAHVVTYTKLGTLRSFEDYFIRFASDNDYKEVELIKYDTDKDIAVLKLVDLSVSYKAIEIGATQKLSFGDKVYAIGNGSNYGLALTQGIVSMPKVNIEYDGKTREVIQCDLTITAGNSGGALLNERGKLVGITTFRTKDNLGNVIYGLAYSISIEIVIEYVN